MSEQQDTGNTFLAVILLLFVLFTTNLVIRSKLRDLQRRIAVLEQRVK